MNSSGATPAPTEQGTAAPSRQGLWLVSPVYDLLFVANLSWILILGGALLWPTGEDPAITFWQIYFITTPHRWITLILVATDQDRRVGRSKLFSGIAIATAVVVVGLYLMTGDFLCLVIVDVVWNSWHFASQHGGVVRMYARLGGGGRRRLENYAVRGLAMYTILRLLGWPTGWTESYPIAAQAVLMLDWAVMIPGVVLLALEFSDQPTKRLGKVCYLSSFFGIYACLLIALHTHTNFLVVPLAVAGAMFHAVEYLAIVTYYARRRRHQGSPALFQTMARNWGLVLAFYVVLLGALGAFFDGDETRSFLGIQLKEAWVGMNLWAAFLHYAYDGMIWKLRQPATAKVLGVEVAGASAKV